MTIDEIPLEMRPAERRVFIYTGNVTHLIDPNQPHLPDEEEGRERALCGTQPWWPGRWFELGVHEDRLDIRPICTQCLRVREAYK